VLRALLTESKRCYDHPHRIVQTACARCRTPYCDECLTTRRDGLFARIVAQDERAPAPLFCERCVGEVEALQALEAERKRPLRQRLRPTRAGVHRAAVYVAVVAVLLVPMALLVRNLAATTLTPEELARFKIGLLGTFQTAEGTNFVSQVYGGSFLRASSPAQAGRDPSRLIDTWATPATPGWRSLDASVPQELVFALPRPLKVNKVILRPQPDEPPETWVKDFEVLVSSVSADGGFERVVAGSVDLQRARAAVDPDRPGEPASGAARFEFPEAAARYVMLRVLSNHGSAAYVSLGEFEVYWVRK
jgi:hypothetical protein